MKFLSFATVSDFLVIAFNVITNFILQVKTLLHCRRAIRIMNLYRKMLVDVANPMLVCLFFCFYKLDDVFFFSRNLTKSCLILCRRK